MNAKLVYNSELGDLIIRWVAHVHMRLRDRYSGRIVTELMTAPLPPPLEIYRGRVIWICPITPAAVEEVFRYVEAMLLLAESIVITDAVKGINEVDKVEMKPRKK